MFSNACIRAHENDNSCAYLIHIVKVEQSYKENSSLREYLSEDPNEIIGKNQQLDSGSSLLQFHSESVNCLYI